MSKHARPDDHDDHAPSFTPKQPPAEGGGIGATRRSRHARDDDDADTPQSFTPRHTPFDHGEWAPGAPTPEQSGTSRHRAPEPADPRADSNRSYKDKARIRRETHTTADDAIADILEEDTYQPAPLPNRIGKIFQLLAVTLVAFYIGWAIKFGLTSGFAVTVNFILILVAAAVVGWFVFDPAVDEHPKRKWVAIGFAVAVIIASQLLDEVVLYFFSAYWLIGYAVLCFVGGTWLRRAVVVVPADEVDGTPTH